MGSRFAFLIKRNVGRVIEFLFGWYKVAVVIGLIYGALYWISSHLFPDAHEIIIRLGLIALALAVAVFLLLPLFWTLFRNRIARQKSHNPNLAILKDRTGLRFLAGDVVEWDRTLEVRALVSGLNTARFQISWPGHVEAVSVISETGATVRLNSHVDKPGMKIELDFGLSLPRRRRHQIGYTLRFHDPGHLIKPFVGYSAAYLPEEEMVLGYSVENAADLIFRRCSFPSVSSNSPLLNEQFVESDGSHTWLIPYPVHGLRYSLACLNHER